VPVNEEDLSRKSALTRDQVYQFLVRLSSFNIIRYIPGKKTSLVIFREERLERKGLLISPENYLYVKERYEERLKGMIGYADSSERCRSVILLDYFGEESEPCGTCDVCRNIKNSELNSDEFELITSELKAKLGSESFDAEELVKMSAFPEEKVIKVIRHLLDSNIISRDKNRKLTWRP
jgi:ATP-dependent DNA helicase RecQ